MSTMLAHIATRLLHAQPHHCCGGQGPARITEWQSVLPGRPDFPAVGGGDEQSQIA